jgi:hypothetical protein
MRKESLRRHGMLEQVEGTQGLDLFRRGATADIKEESKFLGEKKANPLGTEIQEEANTPRTNNESILQNYRGEAGLHKLREERPQE